ncbi:MAG: hypothetical protein HY861_03085 [Chlamydiia bacterium]|nr:hypothetical protein [Chlamydiia bacterium]
MKNLSLILAIFSIGAAPLAAERLEGSPSQMQVMQESQRSGEQAIAQIRKAYEKGAYDAFLEEMDIAYRNAKEKNQLTPLAEMRIGQTPEWQEWESRAQKLQEEKNGALLALIQDQAKTSFVEKVRSATDKLSNAEQQKALTRMAALRQMAPGTGKSADENRLIEIDLEYEYKALHLDLPGASALEKREKQSALKMERLDRMAEAAKTFQDVSLQKEMTLYTEHFDARLSQSWDIADLNALAGGRVKPTNALEEKVASTLSLYQEKFSDLTKQFIAEH